MVVEDSEHQILPVLPLKEMVIFPNSITPLFVVRPKSLAALDASIEDGKKIFLVSQKSNDTEDPGPADLYSVGSIADVLQVLRLPDNSAKVLVEGQAVGRLIDFFSDSAFLKAYVVRVGFPLGDKKGLVALRRTVLRQFESYAEFSNNIPEDLLNNIKGTEDPLSVANSVANYASFSVEEKQAILEAETVDAKLLQLSQTLTRENELLEIEHKIITQVKSNISKSQKEYFLGEQLKIIEKELGMAVDDDAEIDELYERISGSKMSEEAKDKALKEMGRLARMAPMSPEPTVSRTHIEWLLDLPWAKQTRDKLDLGRAQKILDQDHYGLEKVKERVIEFLAVLRMVKELKGPILCLVGPPGVGKTSLARSVARAMGRKFVRISLGGVRDEAEVRGHRRTYIGSLPGKIIQSIKKAGSINPVFLLDEVDKMSADFRGDPASALLEVLDPEQNKAFNDHYLEVDYDLSRVMFITTANTTAGIPYALIDRMEIIRLPGYTEMEKVAIARKFLIPKQIKAHGMTRSLLRMPSSAAKHLVEHYTREAGVRQLEREISAICRKAAREMAPLSDSTKRIDINPAKIREMLGPSKFKPPRIEKRPEVGVATGLAWTEVGGELLPVETSIMKGEGKLLLTGKLGEVMQESAKAALSYIRSNAEALGIDPDFHRHLDLHVHLPEGAIPKDGPSAGVALITSIVSALSGRPVSRQVAMTGEITLRGKVLKIGGLKEKALAAHRARIPRLLLPEENRDDLEDFPKKVLDEMEFIFVERVEAVLKTALADASKSKKPRSKSTPNKKTAAAPKKPRRRVPRRPPAVAS